MKPTVLMALSLPDTFIDRLAERYRLLGPMPRSAADALPAGAAEAQALLTMGTLRTDAAMIDALPKLDMICCYGTGFEGVDRTRAAARGIVVANAGDANADSVAEFALGQILATTRQLGAADRFVRAGLWVGNSVERMPMVPGLAGRRVGIYGLGQVGSRVAAMLAVFGVAIGYHNRTVRPDVPYAYHDSLIGLARWADILVVAARASVQNRHAVDAKVLEALGPHGHLINISRGIAVDEAALCDALENGAIAGAALDVYETEPHVSDRLKALGNVLLSPHIAANTATAQAAQQRMMLANLEAFFAGGTVVSEVRL